MLIQILTALACTTAAADPFRVLIDAGHGGRDHGTTLGPVHESDLTLDLARQLHAKLAKDNRFAVALTRERDQTVGLPDRTKHARRFKADLFVSLHVNSSPDVKAHGAEFYFENQLAPDDESLYLAHRENSVSTEADAGEAYDFVTKNNYPAGVRSILTDLLDGDRITKSSLAARAFERAWRGPRHDAAHLVRQAPFRVLKKISAPSVLIELGYLTNAADFADLTSVKHQAQIAEDLYRALVHLKRCPNAPDRLPTGECD